MEFAKLSTFQLDKFWVFPGGDDNISHIQIPTHFTQTIPLTTGKGIVNSALAYKEVQSFSNSNS